MYVSVYVQYWLVFWRTSFSFIFLFIANLCKLQVLCQDSSFESAVAVCQVNPNKVPKVCQVDSRCARFAVANVVFGVAFAFALTLLPLPLHLLLLPL